MAKTRIHPLPSIESLRNAFLYDAATGELRWKNDRYSGWKYSRLVASKGTIVGQLNKRTGYWCVSAKATTHHAHRIIWAMTHGKWPDDEIDHINGNRSDNRLCNLREATRQQNNYNKNAQSNNFSTGIKGVSRFQKISQITGEIITKYTARIGRKHIGFFDSAEAAAEAYNIEAKKLHGKFYKPSLPSPRGRITISDST